MLQYTNMRNIIKGPKTTWIDILKPTQKDVDYLGDLYHFHPMVLGELIPRCYHPRLEVGPDYLFIILNYPVYHEINREVRPKELDMIVTKDIIVTNHHRPISSLENLFRTCRASEEGKEKYLGEGPGYFLFCILDIFWRDCLVKLDGLNENIDQIERKIFQGKEKEMVKEISLIKTDIIDFWRIVEPQNEIMVQLERVGPKFFGEELSLHFSDALGTYEKIWQTLKAHKETILALEDTNQSLLSTKTNEIIKILTVFSVIMLPLTLLASIWGMNVNLPFAEHQAGFWKIVGGMLTLIVVMFLYFRKKKWL